MRLIAIAFFFFGLLGCAQDPQNTETTHVTFNFSVPKVSQNDRHSWGGAIPTVAADIECVGIFASYPEDTAKGTCYTPGGTAVLTVSKMLGTFSPTSSQSGSFTSGTARTFYLIGFQSTSGVCTSFSSLNESDLSRPYLLGQTTVNLDGQTATVNLSGAVSTAQEFDQCSGGPFEISQDGIYGNGELGNYSYTSGTTYLDTTTEGIRYGKIIEIDSSVGNVITLDSGEGSSFSANDFVMWNVSAFGNSATDCGSATTRWLGEYDVTRVISISGDTLTLEDAIGGPGDSTLNHASTGTLRSTSATNGANWCKIQLIKVPEFRNLTIASGAMVTINTTYNSITGKGGVLPIAVSGTLTLGGSIHVNGKGYQGGSTAGYSGYGRMGISSSATSIQIDGGGGAATAVTYGAGGGGGVKDDADGTDGAANSGSGGFGHSASCGECLVMGGGGGPGGGSISGGSGGGVIVILAHEIVANSGAIINSIGSDGSNGGADAAGGGGAGGNIVIKANSITDNGLSISVTGGAGGTTTDSGEKNAGGGGGGFVGFETCTSFTPGPIVHNSGTCGTGGAGTCGSASPNSSYVGTQTGCD